MGGEDRWSPASIPQQVLQTVSKRRITQTIINRVFLEMQGMLAAHLGNINDPNQEAIDQLADEAVVSAAEAARRRALSKVGTVKPEAIEALRKRDRELQQEGSKLMFRRVASQIKMKRLLDKLEAVEKEKSFDGVDRPPAHGASTSGQITQLWRGWLKNWSRRRKSVSEEREKNMRDLAAIFALGNLKKSLSNAAQTTRNRATAIILGSPLDSSSPTDSSPLGSKRGGGFGSPLHRGNSMGKIMRVGSILPPAVPATKQPSSFHFSSVRFDSNSGAVAAGSVGGDVGNVRQRPIDTTQHSTSSKISPRQRTVTEDDASPLVAPKPDKPILVSRPTRKDSIVIKKYEADPPGHRDGTHENESDQDRPLTTDDDE
jgi:hypothetical protein